MNNSRNLLLTVAAFVILGSAAARADVLSVSFDTPTLSAVPGETVTFSGTVTNLDNAAIVDLNGCGITLPGDFTTDCSPFLSNGPVSLNPGETSPSFPMFTVSVDVPFTGAYGLPNTGVFTILGGLETNGYDSNTQDTLVAQPFSVVVTPEPGSAALLGIGISLTLLCSRASQSALSGQLRNLKKYFS